MIEQSAGLNFFLKTPKNKSNIRFVYLRVTIDGIPKETSTKRKWDVNRWNQKTERAIGTKEDARSLNFFLESLTTKINNFKTELINAGITITAARIIDHIKGNDVSKITVLKEFKRHNDEILALVPTGEYAEGTYERYVTARSHVHDFIEFKFGKADIEFRELNYEFIKDYEFYLKTVRGCSNNTTLKYIANFKKIVLRAIAKDYISKDPFILFKKKWTKPNKKPLSKKELQLLEEKRFSTERLSVVRDIFVFQCYTGLAYIDVYQLKKTNIKTGIDGKLWIISSRQKSKSCTDIPLLPKAIEIMEKYKDHPVCIERGSVLPVKSNQKMNEYLKEIGTLCGLNCTLNTHKARRTFATTVTLANGVPIHVVKELLGHYSVKQTEEYAITEQESISKEMALLQNKFEHTNNSVTKYGPIPALESLKEEINALKAESTELKPSEERLRFIVSEMEKLRELLTHN